MTNKPRRAFIVNFRPKAMVDYERQNNYDHGKGGMEEVKGLGQKVHKEQEEGK
jgi:hypothetical protein